MKEKKKKKKNNKMILYKTSPLEVCYLVYETNERYFSQCGGSLLPIVCRR